MQPTIIEGFINTDTASKMNDYLRSKVKINPHGVFNVQLEPLNLDDSVMEDLVRLSIDSISNKFGFSKDEIKLDRALYQVLQKGEGLGWHTDAYGGVDGYTETFYSALLYLTDDYRGGEILFYNDNTGNVDNAIAYKPKVGTLVYFKGDENTPHSVNEVISGERSNIILFYTTKIN